jgi:hypothetical protein
VLHRWRARAAMTIELGELEELIAEAWLCRAPRRLAREYLDGAR